MEALPGWVSLLTQGGVAVVLAAWLWVEQQRSKAEREERIAIQKANDALRDAYQERMLKALNDVAHAIRETNETQRSSALVIEGLKNAVITEKRS